LRGAPQLTSARGNSRSYLLRRLARADLPTDAAEGISEVKQKRTRMRQMAAPDSDKF
jgi:hypothetical protein